MPVEARMLPILAEPYSRLPLLFVPNQGQAKANVSYIAEKLGYYVGVSAREVSLSLCNRNERSIGFHLAWRFLDSNAEARVEGLDREPGLYHYVLDSDLISPCTNLPSYRKVICRSLWPNIDVVVQERDRAPKFDWIVRPGGNPDRIGFVCEGCTSIRLVAEGRLHIDTELGSLADPKPHAYQIQSEGMKQIPCCYRLVSDSSGNITRIGFKLFESFDASRELYIGPGTTA